MVPFDLQEYIALLGQEGELSRVHSPLDTDQEIAAWIDHTCKMTGGGKALLFDNVKGFQLPVAANLFGSEKRMQLCFGEQSVSERADKLKKDLAATGEQNAARALQSLMLSQAGPLQILDTADWCLHVAEEIGLDQLPALKAWPGDGGRYLTLAQVYTYHPETLAQNCGMYRVQVVDASTALLRCHPGSGGAEHLAAWHRQGKPMPVAIALGGPPLMTWAAGTSLPEGVSEAAFFGYLTGQPLHVSRCEDPNLFVPASAEIVIEGQIRPNEEMLEGPFGNHTGRYVPAAMAPVLCVTHIWRKADAVYPCTIVGPPPMENIHLAQVSAKFLLPLLQHDHSWVCDVNLPGETIFHKAAMVAVDSDRPAGEIAEELRQSVLLRKAKLLVLLNRDIDVHATSLVYWQIMNAENLPARIKFKDTSILLDARDIVSGERPGPTKDIVMEIQEKIGH